MWKIREIRGIAADVLTKQIEGLGIAQIAHQLLGEIRDAPAAPLQIDRAEAEASCEVNHIGFDWIEIESKTHLALAIHQRNLVNTEVEGVKLTGDRGITTVQPTAGAVVAAGIEIPHQVRAGPWGQFKHHAVRAATVEHKTTCAFSSKAENVVLNVFIAEGTQRGDQVLSLFIYVAVFVEINSEVLISPSCKRRQQLGFANRAETVANERVAVDATHQLIKTEGANIGRRVGEPQQELKCRGT